MLDELSRTARFRKWAETVARGELADYPDRDAMAEDARVFLKRWDDTRRELRALEQRQQSFRSQLGELAGSPARAEDTELLEALRQAIKRAENEHRSADDRTREHLAMQRAELQAANSELEKTRAELEKERRKLEPVLRYAYNLRRLVQHIHTRGTVSPDTLQHIEKLLAAGGVAVRKPPQPRGKNAGNTKGSG